MTTVDEINIGPISNTQSREKNSILEPERPSLVNLKNLGYNIFKSLNDETVRDIEFPELDSCSECDNDILMSPLKTFSYLTCGYIFHRFCIEKKLFLDTSSACPASGCGKNVNILNQADALGIVSNLPIPDSRVISQSSEISPLSNLMETFTLSSPPVRMGGIKDIVHYNCIDNSQKLYPICPSTDMEIDDLETPTKQSSSTAQKKTF
ncbi:hypothetical protein C1646_678053 [Rhizophagus diaphanus]|nr:hypothetical protein C1646_678053 [Rhizophagus diaphanus] [Rhizophagus sp. MUCL 43196]